MYAEPELQLILSMYHSLDDMAEEVNCSNANEQLISKTYHVPNSIF
jgi:hypothetical protein